MTEVLWESAFHQQGNRPREVRELSDSHTVIEPHAWTSFPGGLVVKNPANARSCRRFRFDPWVGRISSRRKW